MGRKNRSKDISLFSRGLLTVWRITCQEYLFCDYAELKQATEVRGGDEVWRVSPALENESLP